MSEDENNFDTDLITLVDDEGKEHEFEIIDEIENDEGHFMALVPTDHSAEDVASDETNYYIFEVVEEDGEEQLIEVDDDDKLNRLANIFESRFEESLYGDDEEDTSDEEKGD
jgi:uncharacterized protein YrzB (UPF0473 family)